MQAPETYKEPADLMYKVTNLPQIAAKLFQQSLL